MPSHAQGHLRKPRVLAPLRSLRTRKEQSGVSTLGLRRWLKGGIWQHSISLANQPSNMLNCLGRVAKY